MLYVLTTWHWYRRYTQYAIHTICTVIVIQPIVVRWWGVNLSLFYRFQYDICWPTCQHAWSIDCHQFQFNWPIIWRLCCRPPKIIIIIIKVKHARTHKRKYFDSSRKFDTFPIIKWASRNRKHTENHKFILLAELVWWWEDSKRIKFNHRWSFLYTNLKWWIFFNA